VFALIAKRMGFRIAVPLLSLAIAFAPQAAFAQANNIDVERFKPAVTHDGFVTVESSGMRPTADRFGFGLFLNYGFNPLVNVDGNGDIQGRFVAGRLGFDLLASVTIARPFSIGLGLPFFIAQTGDGNGPSFAGLGDVRIVPKLRILDDEDSIGLGIVAELRAPTHLGDFSGGARNVVFWPRIVLDHRFGLSGLRFGVNGGVLLRERTDFINIQAASEITYAAALGFRFGGPYGVFEIGGEAEGAVGLVAAQREETPLEVRGYVKINPTDEWEIVAGPGFGVIPGYGVPTARIFAGVRFTPTSHDQDHDGITDAADECPDQVENRNGYQDRDGCPDEEPDDDRDGVANSEDECPGQKETINGIQDEDGCPDGGPAKVIREDGEIVILESIRFKTGSAEVEPESYTILNQVALVIKANPDIKRVRVEGHTDSTGSRERNIELSKERARAVREHLIRRGVSPRRLTSEGYGPDKPKVSGDDEASRAKNRRVDFVLEQ
jgi:OmpA-OmpF porin, OOP family